MLTLYIFLGVFAALILVLTFIGLGQPKVASTSASILISGTPEEVFEQCSSLRNFVHWSPWSEKDPNMEQTFSENDSGVGSCYHWQGNRKVGTGSMTITEVIPNKKVELELIFGNRGKSISAFTISEEDNKTRVTWSFESNIGSNPLQRAMIPMMNKLIRKDFEHGLQNLKKHLFELIA